MTKWTFFFWVAVFSGCTINEGISDYYQTEQMKILKEVGRNPSEVYLEKDKLIIVNFEEEKK